MYEKKNFYTVYKHTSPSGKVYIGITGKKWKRDGSMDMVIGNKYSGKL